MGLLDDAIREHLELKRRHGASPDEVERQEREALGAARRDDFPPPPESESEPEAEPAAAPCYDEDPWLEEERDEVPAEETLDRPAEGPPQEGEDVLEETPEFLQE